MRFGIENLIKGRENNGSPKKKKKRQLPEETPTPVVREDYLAKTAQERQQMWEEHNENLAAEVIAKKREDLEKKLEQAQPEYNAALQEFEAQINDFVEHIFTRHDHPETIESVQQAIDKKIVYWRAPSSVGEFDFAGRTPQEEMLRLTTQFRSIRNLLKGILVEDISDAAGLEIAFKRISAALTSITTLVQDRMLLEGVFWINNGVERAVSVVEMYRMFYMKNNATRDWILQQFEEFFFIPVKISSRYWDSHIQVAELDTALKSLEDTSQPKADS